MMLVAQFRNGFKIELTGRWTREELLELRKTKKFYCPTCHGEVILKLGTKKQWHFAHVRENKICQSFERESNFHLLGKKQLYHWLKRTKHVVYLEKFFPNIRQRPDIYYEHSCHKVALEFQCSPISTDLHFKRTLSYQKHNIYPLWIIGANCLERITKNIFQLHSFEWSSTFLTKNQNYPCLLYYCPNKRCFILLQNIISLTKSKIFASIKVEEITSLSSFPKLFLNKTDENVKKTWLQLKKHWRYSNTPYPSKSLRFFREYCYKRKLLPSLFPAISGWPIHFSYFIETPLYIWQSWLVYEYISSKSIDDVIDFYDIYEAFKHNLRIGVFSVRLLPLHEGHFSFAIMKYLQLLCDFGILRKKMTHLFQINRQIEQIKTVQEAFSLDDYYSKMIKFS